MSSNANIRSVESAEARSPTRPAPGGTRRRVTRRGCQTRRTPSPLAERAGEGADVRPLETIDDLVADSLRRHTELGTWIDAHAADLDADTLLRLFALHGQNASRLGRLLRDKRALSGQATDGLLSAIATALDEISTELGVSL